MVILLFPANFFSGKIAMFCIGSTNCRGIHYKQQGPDFFINAEITCKDIIEVSILPVFFVIQKQIYFVLLKVCIFMNSVFVNYSIHITYIV